MRAPHKYFRILATNPLNEELIDFNLVPIMKNLAAPNGSQPSAKGPADYFTGTVRVDAPFKGTEQVSDEHYAQGL
jgi:hypothetical protein